jgi:hypothetical protein
MITFDSDPIFGSGQSVEMAVEERDTVALFRGCSKVQSRNKNRDEPKKA